LKGELPVGLVLADEDFAMRRSKIPQGYQLVEFRLS
jgi:hypothetical protein